MSTIYCLHLVRVKQTCRAEISANADDVLTFSFPIVMNQNSNGACNDNA